jgi:hypothetical protein
MTTQDDGIAGQTAGAPGDNTTLREVLAGYEGAGFRGTFTVEEQGRLLCNTCNTSNLASDFWMHSLRRMEGASDPDDMLSVSAITCPTCQTKGVVVLGYGPNATAEDSDVFKGLQDCRWDDELTGNSAPGEAAGDATPRA